MASIKAYLDFILDQLSGLDEISCGASDMKLVPTKHSDAAVRLRGRNDVRRERQKRLKTGLPKSRQTFWEKEEQRNE